MPFTYLADADPAVASAISAELTRQRGSIELIASENFTSTAVMEAVGCVLGAAGGISGVSCAACAQSLRGGEKSVVRNRVLERGAVTMQGVDALSRCGVGTTEEGEL